jgi:DnaJ-class molecular chaperone
MSEPRTCPVCSGQQGTEKVQHTVERDENGNMVARENRYWSPCNMCGGSGVVTG